MIERAQCLLLFESGGQPGTRSTRRSSNSSAKVLALLPRVFKNTCPEIVPFLKKNNIHIVDESCKPPTHSPSSNSTKLEVLEFEVQMTATPEIKSGHGKFRLNFYESDKKLARVFFSECDNKIIFDYEYRNIEPFSAFDEESTQFLVSCLTHSVQFSFRHPDGLTFLHFAARAGSLAVVKSLLKIGCAVDVADSDEWTPLHFAAIVGNLKMTKLLIEHGADANAGGNTIGKENGCVGCTPLLLAARCGSLEVVKFLLDKGADISVVNHLGCEKNFNAHDVTPLHLAAKAGHFQVVRLLTQRAARIDVKARYWIFNCPSPLSEAAENGHSKVVKLLLDRGANVHGVHHVESSVGRTALHFAAENGHLETVKTLLGERASIDAKTEDGRTPLLSAAERKHLGICKFLVDTGADLNVVYLYTPIIGPKIAEERSLFTIAFCAENRELLNLILSRRNDLNGELVTKAFFFSLCRLTTFCKENANCLFPSPFELNFGSLFNFDKTELLFGAIHKTRLDILEQLLTDGVDVNTFHEVNDQKETPLHWAVIQGNNDAVKLLLRHGAELNIKNESGLSPAIYAIKRHNIDILKLLVSNKANTRDPNVMLFSVAEAEELVEFLLNHGADPNSAYKSLPITVFAASKGKCQSLKLLLKFGASISLENALAGKEHDISNLADVTLLHMAVAHKQSDVLQFLLDYCFHDVTSICTLQVYVVNENSCQWGASALGRNIIKMMSAELPICGTKLDELLALGEVFADYQDDCEAEAEMLKNEKLEGTDVSLFDVLANDDRVVAYARNDSINEYFETGNYKNKFPIYASILDWQFEKGCHRRDSLAYGIRVFSALFRPFVALPDELKEKIVGLLDNLELQLLRCL